MNAINFLPICTYMTMVIASLTIRRTGWLDRVVQYYSNNLIEDLQKLPLVPIKATIERAPEGYKDSPDWNFESVIRLLLLLKESPHRETQQVRRAIRRSLKSSRRFISNMESHKLFPSLTKFQDIDDIYYNVAYDDVTAAEAPKRPVEIQDNDIVFINNPVESRLPSARISVKLLREILENRAQAARYIPRPIKELYTWPDPTKANPGAKTSKTASKAPDAAEPQTTVAPAAATSAGNDVKTTAEAAPTT